MKRFLALAASVLVAAACQDRPDPVAPAGPPVPEFTPSFSVAIDPALTDALASATDSDTLEVIVNFDETLTTLSALTDAVLDLGAGVIQFEHLSMVAARATPTQITAIQTLVGVQSIYLNSELRYLNAEGIASINADDVHALGITGKGIGVAILDSGIDGLHPDLEYPTKTVQNVKHVADLREEFHFKGKNNKLKKATDIWVEGVANSETSIGHGTHVAGTAAGTGEASSGKYKGVAPGAHLVGLGAGDVLFIFWVLAGFDYILDHHEEYNIKVVNNSWGSDGSFDPENPTNEATQEVHDAGVTVVFAGGNSGPDQNTMNRYSVAPWVISVAAGCKLGEDPTNSRSHCNDGRSQVIADFSSRGIPGDPMYRPDVTAPGVHVVSTRASTGTVMNGLDSNHDARICAIDLEHEPYYTCASGTSMASPHVAGVVALLQEAAGGTLTPDEVLDVLTKTAQPLPSYEAWEVGAGYVDALAAVEAVMK
jgi:serine protease AprX